jgi:N-acetylglucosamine-6-phosphate deacetylase
MRQRLQNIEQIAIKWNHLIALESAPFIFPPPGFKHAIIMALTAFLADAVHSHQQVFPHHALLTENGRVTGIIPRGDIPVGTARVDLPGLTLAPGLIDAQINGGGGVLFNDETTPEGIAAIGHAHARCGTTGFLVTLISDDLPKSTLAMRAVAAARKTLPTLLGLHLEGPFLNPARRGIHAASKITGPDLCFLDEAALPDSGTILMTIAPEKFTTFDLAKISARNIRLAAGHSEADEATLERAKGAGLNGVTHLFNGMGGMSARAPGVSGVALIDDDLYCSIIADGMHVSPVMLRLAMKTKPKGKLFLVSDAMPPAGKPDMKEFMLTGTRISVKEGRCTDENGHLAGACLTLFECIRLCCQRWHLPLGELLYMSTLAPAQFLKIDHDTGSLEPNKRANFIAFDKEMKLEKVFVDGLPI